MLSSRSRPWRAVLPRKEAGPLRCMFVTTSMPVGGAETLLVNLLRRLDHDHFQPEVVCLKEPGPLGEQISDEFPVHSRLLSSKWDLRVLPRLMRLFHRGRADVVVTVGAGDKMFWGRIAAHIVGVPVIASALHSTGWPDGVGRLNRTLTRITDTFIAVADSHGDFLRDFEGFPSDKVRVIRNGIDCNRFRPDEASRHAIRSELGLADETPLVGIVAALRPEKNHGMIVQTAGRLRRSHPDAYWLIIGDGPERPSIEKMIREVGVGDRVHMLGTRHDTPRLLAALDLFTLSSLNEASPVSILEALASGVPVVSTDVGSIRESIINGTTGMLVPPGDVDAMSRAVSQILDDQAARVAMSEAGREHVLRTGSLQSMVDGYQRMMTDLYDIRLTSIATKRCPRSREKVLSK